MDIAQFEQVGFAMRDATHAAHLASKSYAEHMALGGFYDGIVDLVDSFVENAQGRTLQLAQPGQISSAAFMSSGDITTVLKEYVKWLDGYRATVPFSELQNTIDSILTLTNSTIYKLTFLK